jgi:hypothetical protein
VRCVTHDNLGLFQSIWQRHSSIGGSLDADDHAVLLCIEDSCDGTYYYRKACVKAVKLNRVSFAIANQPISYSTNTSVYRRSLMCKEGGYEQSALPIVLYRSNNWTPERHAQGLSMSCQETYLGRSNLYTGLNRRGGPWAGCAVDGPASPGMFQSSMYSPKRSASSSYNFRSMMSRRIPIPGFIIL